METTTNTATVENPATETAAEQPTLSATEKPAKQHITWWIITAIGTISGAAATTSFLPGENGAGRLPELLLSFTTPAAIIAAITLLISATLLPNLTKKYYGYAQGCGWLVAPFAITALLQNMFRWDDLINTEGVDTIAVWAGATTVALISAFTLIARSWQAAKRLPAAECKDDVADAAQAEQKSEEPQ